MLRNYNKMKFVMLSEVLKEAQRHIVAKAQRQLLHKFLGNQLALCLCAFAPLCLLFTRFFTSLRSVQNDNRLILVWEI